MDIISWNPDLKKYIYKVILLVLLRAWGISFCSVEWFGLYTEFKRTFYWSIAYCFAQAAPYTFCFKKGSAHFLF